MPMIGKDRHLRRLRRMAGPEVVKEATAALQAGADAIRAEAHHLISRGSVSGKSHVPSAPGEPPNRDSGHLQAHIEASQPKPLLAEVRSNAEYAATLEFGDSKTAARPYMRPARDKLAKGIAEDLAKRLDRLSKG